MKICDQSKERKGFPEVKPGDVVKIKNFGYYLVCAPVRDIPAHLRNLETGSCFTNPYGSFWGGLSRENVSKVNACLKIAE